MLKTNWRVAVICMVLVAATLGAYWPVYRAQFTNFDDPEYVTNNPHVFHGLTWRGAGWAFTAFHGSNWHPLTWLSHMLDCSIFGENPSGHHLVNLGFHVANTLLLFLLLWRLTGAVWRSGFVAALFALHPLHVESVAWIAERKDVLSTFFGLLSLWAYARYAQGRSRGERRGSSDPSGGLARDARHSTLDYLLTLGFFALGLMGKPMLVTLPFGMLLLDYWPLQRLQFNPQRSRLELLFPLVREKLPFFALSLASSAVTFWAQKAGCAVVTLQAVPLPDRLANVFISYLQYLSKTFWPADLSAFYPFAKGIWIGEAALALLMVSAATVLAFFAARRTPAVLMGWLWFLGTLVPVIGLVQVGSQAMADRYTYIPLIGVFIAITWGLADRTAKWRCRRLALGLSGAVVLAGCFVVTRFQVGYWNNSLSLFAHAVETTQGNWMAEHNLGHALSVAGNYREALQRFNRAIQFEPGYPPSHFTRAGVHALQGRLDEAIVDYHEAIRLKPNYEQAYCNLAKVLAQQLRFEEARTNFLAALRWKPDYAEAHTKLGNLLVLQGLVSEAMPHLREAVKIQPDYDEGQYFLGGALARQKQFVEAAACFRAAIKANPNYSSALNDLAWLLATRPEPRVRNVPEAVELARRACEATGYANPGYLDTLGVAQSEAGQLREAIRLTEKAAELASASGDAVLAEQLQTHLTIYHAGRSYTQGPRVPAAASPQ